MYFHAISIEIEEPCVGAVLDKDILYYFLNALVILEGKPSCDALE